MIDNNIINIFILVILILIMIILGLILTLKIVKEREEQIRIENTVLTLHKNLNNNKMKNDIQFLKNNMNMKNNLLKNDYESNNITNKILDELIKKYGGYNETIHISKKEWLENKSDYIKKEYEENMIYYKEDYENKIKDNQDNYKKEIEKIKNSYKTKFEEDWKLNKNIYIKYYKENN
jgi:hypothetical protein